MPVTVGGICLFGSGYPSRSVSGGSRISALARCYCRTARVVDRHLTVVAVCGRLLSSVASGVALWRFVVGRALRGVLGSVISVLLFADLY